MFNAIGYKNFQKVWVLRIYKRCFLFLCIAILIISSYGMVAAGEESPVSAIPSDRLFSEASFIVGFGPGFIHRVHYETALIILHLGIDLDKYYPSLKSYKGKLSFFIEPQFNPEVNSGSDYELGLGLGLQYRYPVDDKISAYIRAGISPHYFTKETIHQADGFIFSDVIGAGVYYHLSDSSAINLGCWLRHLSNAAIEKPNDGVNSIFGVIGYTIFFN